MSKGLKNLQNMKGQSSLEQLVITGIALTFIALIFVFSINYTNDTVRKTQAKDTVDKLAKTADYVYALGPGTKQTVRVQMPSGVQFITVSGNRIQLRVSLSSGDADVFANTRAALTGAVPITDGAKDVSVFATSNNKVFLGDSGISCSPLTLTKSFQQGQSGNDSINVTNIVDYTITGIVANLSGITDLLSLTQPASTLTTGNSTTVGLSFSIPSNKTVGSYAGAVTVNGSNSSECTTAITVQVTRAGGADLQGPLVTSIVKSPNAPRATSSIVINATGNDSTTGNSTISLCQLEIDSSGIWNDMSVVDGVYDEIEEPVTYTVGTLGFGQHTARIRCIDSAGNIGPSSSLTFISYKKDILIVTVVGSANTNEQRWIDWITTHSSGSGYSWDYDQVQISDVREGTTNVSNYIIVVAADFPNGNSTYISILNSYRSTNYVALLGISMQNGVSGLSFGTGNGQSTSISSLNITASHTVTNGFTLNSLVTIDSGNSPMYYHDSFTGTKIAASESDSTKGIIIEGTKVITYGPTRPDTFNSNGDTIATRVLDYAITNSG